MFYCSILYLTAAKTVSKCKTTSTVGNRTNFTVGCRVTSAVVVTRQPLQLWLQDHLSSCGYRTTSAVVVTGPPQQLWLQDNLCSCGYKTTSAVVVTGQPLQLWLQDNLCSCGYRTTSAVGCETQARKRVRCICTSSHLPTVKC